MWKICAVPTVSDADELAPLAAGSNSYGTTFCSESSVATASHSSSSLLSDNRNREDTAEASELTESKLLLLIPSLFMFLPDKLLTL